MLVADVLGAGAGPQHLKVQVTPAGEGATTRQVWHRNVLNQAGYHSGSVPTPARPHIVWRRAWRATWRPYRPPAQKPWRSPAPPSPASTAPQTTTGNDPLPSRRAFTDNCRNVIMCSRWGSWPPKLAAAPITTEDRERWANKQAHKPRTADGECPGRVLLLRPPPSSSPSAAEGSRSARLARPKPQRPCARSPSPWRARQRRAHR